jgi:hypothetical protein
MTPVDVPPIDFHWQSGTATIEWIVLPDRKTGLGSGLIRYLNYKHSSDNLPYRGVTNIAVKNWVFEFKGACFWRKGDRPFKEEHEDIKDHLTNPDPRKGWGMEGFALRQKAGGRIVVKRYRWRKKGAVTVGGNNAQKLNCGEIKMPEDLKVQDGKKLVYIELSAYNQDGTLFDMNKKFIALDQQSFANLQGLFISGVQTPLVQIGQDLAKKAAAAQPSV